MNTSQCCGHFRSAHPRTLAAQRWCRYGRLL